MVLLIQCQENKDPGKPVNIYMALTGYLIAVDYYSLPIISDTIPIIAKGLLLYDFRFFRSPLPFSSCTLTLTL